MAKRRIDIGKISSDSEANVHIRFVINYIERTPSMTAKLPKMVLDRVSAVMEFWRRRK